MSAPPRAGSPNGEVGPRNGETISVIGAGRVGTALAVALASAGHGIAAVSTVAHRERVGRLLPGTPVLPPDEVAATGDVVIIAVPDDVLAGLVRSLAGLRRGCFVVHTSGAHGLEPLRPAGDLIAAVHPAMTFTGEATPTAGVTFGVTASPAAEERAARLVADLGGAPEWIAERDRTLYHAALAHGANHLVTLVNEAVDRLRDAGVRAPERVLRPLLAAALDNSLERGDAALTGPVSRGDAGTVAGHLEALGAVAPESVPPYVALARRTTQRAIAAGRLPEAAELLNALGAFDLEPHARPTRTGG